MGLKLTDSMRESLGNLADALVDETGTIDQFFITEELGIDMTPAELGQAVDEDRLSDDEYREINRKRLLHLQGALAVISTNLVCKFALASLGYTDSQLDDVYAQVEHSNPNRVGFAFIDELAAFTVSN